mgnify:CR=1 FL=1
MPRIICIDYGGKRCGLAVTDPLQIIATALLTVETKNLYTFLADYLKIIEDADKTKIFAYNRAMDQIHGDRKLKSHRDEAINLAKVYLLRQFFERIEAKGQHLKDLI